MDAHVDVEVILLRGGLEAFDEGGVRFRLGEGKRLFG